MNECVNERKREILKINGEMLKTFSLKLEQTHVVHYTITVFIQQSTGGAHKHLLR